MKRAVLCVPNPQDYIDQLTDYSLMIVNPAVDEMLKNTSGFAGEEEWLEQLEKEKVWKALKNGN